MDPCYSTCVADMEIRMLTIVRCAVVIGVIYAFSPVRDPRPAAPALPRAVEDASRAWSAMPESARRALLDTLARDAAEHGATLERALR